MSISIKSRLTVASLNLSRVAFGIAEGCEGSKRSKFITALRRLSEKLEDLSRAGFKVRSALNNDDDALSEAIDDLCAVITATATQYEKAAGLIFNLDTGEIIDDRISIKNEILHRGILRQAQVAIETLDQVAAEICDELSERTADDSE